MKGSIGTFYALRLDIDGLPPRELVI